jgi:hypothetical protein
MVELPCDFDPAVYVSLHPDLLAAKVDGAEHYAQQGAFEGRTYRLAFDADGMKLWDRNLESLADPRFVRAYARSAKSRGSNPI